VRRVIATSLLLLFLLPLISPLFAASAVEANLPACCQRDARHYCVMSTMTKSRANDAEAIQATALREKCPSYPAPPVVTTHIDLSPDEARTTTFFGVVGFETCVAQTEGRFRISFDRSRQKRGPPNQPLSFLVESLIGAFPHAYRFSLGDQMQSYRHCHFVILFLLVFVSLLQGQQTINNATLSGRVTDPEGALVQQAPVTAKQVTTNIVRSTSTDAAGRFRFPYLSVGSYEISIEQPGFAVATRSVTLTVGGDLHIPIVLAVAGNETSVNVSAVAPVLEMSRSEVTETISPEEIQNLSSLGRNFLDFALLVPGVSPTNTASTQLFAETSAVPGQGISIGSQRNLSNSFIVDGLSSNDDAAGLTGTFYGLDVVREFQVITSGGQAEFGRALGGYINTVTKSGTNALHGDVYGFLRSQRLNASNALSQSTLPLTQAQYGASLGGPVLHNRTFYFANFERKQLNQDGIITIAPASVAIINARLKRIGYQGPLISTGLYSNPVRTNNFFAKVDHHVSAADELSLRYSLYEVDSQNSRGAGGLSAVTAAAGLHNLDQTIAVSNIATISAKTVNETRGQYTHSDLNALPNDPFGPAVSISGVASFGTLSVSPQGRTNNLYEVVNNISHQVGPHSLRLGVDFLFNDLKIVFPQSNRGSYAYSSLSNFLNGVYNTSGYTQSFGSPVVSQANPTIGAYGQDEWKVSPSLTLNAGLRYDLQFLKSVSTDTNNISPRIGFAWSPFTNDNTIVRGSFGLFYDRIPLRALSNALQSSNNTTNINSSTFVTVSLSPTQTGAPPFPDILPSLPSGVLVNFTTMAPHMQNAYSEQASLQIEQKIGDRSSLGISYQHMRGLHLIISVNQNTPTCAATGSNNGCRPNASYGNNKQYQSAADSFYDGLSVSYVQRPVRWGSYRISYTWSKAMDDVGEFFFSSPINNFNIAQDRSLSDDDQRHRVVFAGTVHTSMDAAHDRWSRIRNGFLLSGMLQYYSALPFNVTTGSNSIQGTTLRPCVPGVVSCTEVLPGTTIGRNAGVGFDSFTMNVRLSRTFPMGERFRLEGIAEAFNALNHRNDLIPNGTFGMGAYPVAPASGFGRATAVGDPRQVQLAMRLTF
jgi:Carboxypeptidase regulatory-like domain/TonB dependent receptor